ncbi:MAG: M28 family peptidase, partial [bacterium]
MFNFPMENMMSPVRSASTTVLGLLLVFASVASAQVTGRGPTVRRGQKTAAIPSQAELPLKYVGKPTVEAITAADLMTRLYIFADDSMMGREVGTKYNLIGTSYIEQEVRRLGLVPAGENGGYFQNLPVFTTYFDSTSSVSIGSDRLTVAKDFLPIAREERRIVLDGTPVVYAGESNDSTSWLSADEMGGKIVVFNVPAPGVVLPNVPSLRARIARAVAVFVVSLDRGPENQKAGALRIQSLQRDGAVPGTPNVLITSRVASLLFGSLEGAKAGTIGKSLSGAIIIGKAQAPGRNVVAILPGSDPALKGQYVAIGAHNDHIGFSNAPVDHDSIRVYNMVARPQGADSPRPAKLTDEQIARIRVMTDSLHALHGMRLDSISNGADDDGTGTVSVLEIAEAFAKAKVRPKRSVLFVWHAGEEKGLWGSMFFTDHPTVPRDSIVAQLNIDMVGRGALADATGESRTGELLHGGPGYLQLVGSRRLSTELGDLMETVNTKGKFGFNFDYGMDTNGHPQNIYCRSDHYEYARYGIPIVFMTTGG